MDQPHPQSRSTEDSFPPQISNRILFLKVHGHMGKEGRNQTRSTQPRHTQGLNHFRTEAPPSPQGSGTASALSSMAAGPEGENRMQMKGEDVGEGADLSSFFTPRPLCFQNNLYTATQL